ncbi:MAG: DPP IV N-terminal domain-containing protein [Chloroflexota bacterium]
MRADGSSPIKLTTTGQNYMPTWSPDGRHIAYYSLRNGEYEIYVINTDGSNEHKITSGGNNFQPVWIP